MKATSMEEGLKAYQDGKFSRQSLFELVVARIKATESRVERLEEQNRQLVSALVRGAQGRTEVTVAQPETAEWDDTAPTVVVAQGFRDTDSAEPLVDPTDPVEIRTRRLRDDARALGIKIDNRWSEATLRQKVVEANGTELGPNG